MTPPEASWSPAAKAYAATIALACVWAFAERMRLPLLPLLLADSGSYLFMALELSIDGEFTHLGGRQFAYPLFLAAIMAVTDDLRAITLVQHGLGVAGALVLLLAWLRLPLPSALGGRTRNVFTWLQRAAGLGLLLAQALNAQTIVYEHHIQPEAISQAVGAVMLLGLVAAFASDPRGQPARFIAWAAVGLFAANLLALLRPQGLLVVPATGLCVLAFAVVRRAPVVPLLASVGTPAVLSLLLLWGPEMLLVAKDPGATTISAKRFLFWHFHIAEPVLREELAAAPEDADASLRTELLGAFEAEQERHEREGRRYHFQSYNPCALYYGAAGEAIDSHFADDREALERFSMDAFATGVRADPWAYLAKIGNNLATFYRFSDKLVPNPRAYVKARPLMEISAGLARRMERTLARHPGWSGYAGEAERWVQARSESEPLIWILGAKSRTDPYWLGYHLLGLASTPALLALLIGLLLPRNGDDGALAWGAASAAIALFGVLLTASALHGLETHRYMLAVTNQAFFATFSGFWLFAVRSFGRIGAGATAQAGTSPSDASPSR